MQKLWVVGVVSLENVEMDALEHVIHIVEQNVLAVVQVAVEANVLRPAVDSAKAHAERAVQDVLIDDLFRRFAKN